LTVAQLGKGFVREHGQQLPSFGYVVEQRDDPVIQASVVILQLLAAIVRRRQGLP
jgi:hypothetical protein